MFHPLTIAFACVLAAAGMAQDKTPPGPPPEPVAPPAPKAPAEDRPEFAFANISGEETYGEICGVLARDPRTGDVGVIVLSSAPGCGAFAIAGDSKGGVVAVGGQTDPTWAARTVRLLGELGTPEAALTRLRETSSPAMCERQMVVTLDRDGKVGNWRGHALLGSETTTMAKVMPDWVVFSVLAGSANTLDALGKAAEVDTDLPLPERLLLAAQAALDAAPKPKDSHARLLNSQTVSAALLVVREKGGRYGLDDRLVDLRVDFDADPLDRLRGLYHVAVRAHLAPALRALQRAAPFGSPAAQADLEWMRRIRAGKKPGER